MLRWHRLETDVAEDVEGMHTDLANTKSAMSEELSQTHQKMAEELSETENRMGEKVTAATSAMKDTQNSMDAAVAQMNKRLDANVTASTDSKADYAAELVDTRVDSEGTTYPECRGSHPQHYGRFGKKNCSSRNGNCIPE